MRLVLACDGRLHLADVALPIRAANQKQLRSFREKFRRAAFVGVKMGILMADNAVERLAELSERQRICRRAIENKVNVAIGLEDFTDAIAHMCGPDILPLRGRVVRTW